MHSFLQTTFLIDSFTFSSFYIRSFQWKQENLFLTDYVVAGPFVFFFSSALNKTYTYRHSDELAQKAPKKILTDITVGPRVAAVTVARVIAAMVTTRAVPTWIGGATVNN